jgi:hypothetical protein
MVMFQVVRKTEPRGVRGVSQEVAEVIGFADESG